SLTPRASSSFARRTTRRLAAGTRSANLGRYLRGGCRADISVSFDARIWIDDGVWFDERISLDERVGADQRATFSDRVGADNSRQPNCCAHAGAVEAVPRVVGQPRT